MLVVYSNSLSELRCQAFSVPCLQTFLSSHVNVCKLKNIFRYTFLLCCCYVNHSAVDKLYTTSFSILKYNRLRAVPLFPLAFVEPRKDIANTGARKRCFSLPRFPRAGVRVVFPRLNELNGKSRDCSQSKNIMKYNSNTSFSPRCHIIPTG